MNTKGTSFNLLRSVAHEYSGYRLHINECSNSLMKLTYEAQHKIIYKILYIF